MKKVERKDLLEMENVLYAKYSESGFPERLFIKYDSPDDRDGVKLNTWCDEPFPITIPENDNSYFDAVDEFEKLPLGIDVPISGLETGREGMYYDLGEVYIVYSKNDIKKMINKLRGLL